MPGEGNTAPAMVASVLRAPSLPWVSDRGGPALQVWWEAQL